MMLSFLSMHCLACLFNITKDYLPKGGTIHNGLGPLISTIDQKPVSQTYPQASVMEAISHPRGSLPRDVYVCVKLTKTNHHNGAVVWLGGCLSSMQETMGSMPQQREREREGVEQINNKRSWKLQNL